jgi:gas vesicle protein
MEDDSRFSYFFLGLGIGVAAGLLFAPKSGPETRQLLKSKAGESGEFLKKRSVDIKESANDLLERSRSAITKQKEHISQAVEAGKQAYREAVGTPAEGLPGDGI